MIDLKKIKFKSIDIDKDLQTCIKFRKDSFIASFGSEKEWIELSGDNGELYVDWLEKLLRNNPECGLHIWYENKIIGQVEYQINIE